MSRHDKTIHNSNTRIQFSFTWASPRLSAVCPACGIPAKLGKKKTSPIANKHWTGWCDMVDWIFQFLNPSNHPHFKSRIGNLKTQFMQTWSTYINTIQYIYVYMSTYQFNDILYTINYTIHSSLLICTQMYCALDKEAIKTCQNYSVI